MLDRSYADVIVFSFVLPFCVHPTDNNPVVKANTSIELNFLTNYMPPYIIIKLYSYSYY